MANYLRKRRMQEISTARDEKRIEREKTVKPVGCPYCFSRSLETHGEQKFCRNCHRYL